MVCFTAMGLRYEAGRWCATLSWSHRRVHPSLQDQPSETWARKKRRTLGKEWRGSVAKLTFSISRASCFSVGGVLSMLKSLPSSSYEMHIVYHHAHLIHF